MRQAAAFGAALRRERERRGISLEQITDGTKVGLALLEALERGDLTRWPTGIFRRAFVRAYAEAAGLDSREVLSEFLRIFPDEDVDSGGLPRPVEPFVLAAFPESALRITLADESGAGLRAVARRLVAVAGDIALVGAAVFLGSLLGAPWSWTSMLGLAGLAYYAIGIVATGTSPVWWWMRRSHRIAHASPALPRGALAARDDPGSWEARDAGGPGDDAR